MSHVELRGLRADVVALIPALRKFARRFCRSDDDANDLVQETLVRGLGAIDTFQPGTRLKSWLFTIMRNTFNTQYARNKRMVIGIDGMEGLMPSAPPCQEWTIRAKELNSALSSLHPDHQIVVDRILIEGQSYEEVSASLGCPVGTVKSRVNRARERLAMRLGESVQSAVEL